MAALAYPANPGKEQSLDLGMLKMLGLTSQKICAGILKILILMASGALQTQNKWNLSSAISGVAQNVILVINNRVLHRKRVKSTILMVLEP